MMVPKASHGLFARGPASRRLGLIAGLFVLAAMPSCLAGGEWGARINGKQGEIVSAAGDGAGGSPQVSSAQPHAREFPALTTPAAAKSLPFLRGINLASATFGRGVARVYGRDYTYPGRDSVNYFREKGFNLIRLGFRWENLQPTPQAPLSADELSRIDGVIDAATGQGMYVAINPHNYARYFGQAISVEVPGDVFADLWARLAEHYKNNPRVIFDLMNEPNKMPIEAVKEMSQAAITAIRSVGARNLILVEGNRWSGAWHWLDSGSDVLAQLSDPGSNLMLSPHQYLDSDGSGTQPECVSKSVGAERLQRITEWARSVRVRLVLGEFGAGANEVCEAAVRGMLSYIRANADVWAGWAWWAGGPWWGSYFSSLEPLHGVDRPQMPWLTPHLEAR